MMLGKNRSPFNHRRRIYSIIFIVQVIALFFLTSCPQVLTDAMFIEERIRPLTVMVYMPADNELESAAIQDINEIEASKFSKEEIAIVALLDRSGGYDETNGNWTDTRLYEITEDAGGLNGVIASKELSSSELALEAGTPTELDMGDPNTLKNFLKFGRANYPAEKYALIIWGRETGWQSIAVDDYSSSSMSLTQLQEAIANSGGQMPRTSGLTTEPQPSTLPLDFIGFDTHFGGNIETVWELKDEASWFAGTSGLAPVSGWDYTEIFDFFVATEMKIEDFADAVASQDGVSKVNLQQISQVKESFDELAQLTANTILTENDRDVVKGLLLTEVDSYTSNTFPSDKFLDLYDLAATIHENSNRISFDTSRQTELQSSATKLQLALQGAVYSGESSKLGVHVIPLTSASVHATRHSTEYIQGSSASEQLSFVHDSAGWVPTSAGTTSLLDKLFYATSFELIVRPWTVMVYMPADNELEGAAIQDINELEASTFNKDDISVLALLDRGDGYDKTNDDWTDTRLYEITEDSGGLNGIITSKELSSSNLALEAGTATELDMGDPNTLKNFLKFGRTNYPAEKYALIIWGRGTGWRSVAIDEYSGSDMSLTQLQEAIASSSTPLDFIGFDTNFGGNIETAWELKDEASWFAGTAGLAPVSGWDYAEVLEDFSASGMDAEDFADAVVAQGGVSKVNLTTITQAKTALDELSQLIADTIKTENDRDVVKGLLLTEVNAYTSNTFPSDKFLDLYDLATTIHQNASRISSNSSIQAQLRSSAAKLQNSLKGAVNSGGTAKLGVHVIPLTSASVHATRHATAYIQGSSASEQLSFVHDSAGWVPTSTGKTSLLDKLFYATSFELIVRPWTVMVYMPADNELEGAAIQDINELEASSFNKDDISVLALLDRNSGHDGTNGNWTDTRLYEITEDSGGLNGIITSKELSSSNLALEVGTATELDMGDPNTLKNFLKFGRENYPAEKYALIIWGRGSGWRSVAIDEYSSSDMSLAQLQEAIASSVVGTSTPLDFIGFDTNFGGNIETAWELKDEASWFAGAPGLAPVSGWDYAEVLEDFSASGMSAEDFADAVASQDGVSKVNLTTITQAKTTLDELAQLTANTILTENDRDVVKGLLLTEVDSYTSNTFPSDKFLDLYDLATSIYKNASRISSDSSRQAELQSSATKLQDSLKGAVSSSESSKLGVHLIPLASSTTPATSHSTTYIQGSGEPEQMIFVHDSAGWVPTSAGTTSLLDKLFYATSFELIVRPWTVMVYMPADNELEGAAIQDINELEASTFNKDDISVLALLDRGDGYDKTNDDWTDTRLYEITEDSGGLNGIITSKELSSSNLALEAGTATELDMGDPNTLKNFLKFGRTNYPAEKYALIIWGRGTGWRSVAIDEYSGSDMSLTQLQEAIASSSTPLDFIGFDTNFGGNIETAWELKDEASWFAGAPGLAPVSGWDYAEVLEDFSASGMDAEDFADAVVAQGGVSKVNLTTITQAKTALDELSQLIADTIKTENDRDVVKNLLLTEVTSYISNIFPSDKFLDLYDLATTIHQNASRISSNLSIQVQLRSSATKLQASLSTVVQSGGTAKLGVHVIPLTSASVHATRHATAYIQGSSASEQLSFVHDSAGWVPTSGGKTSLLDKLFYETSFELIVRPWTVMVYMPADNELEGAAIQDINELEASTFNKDDISVLALLDRSRVYDETNGDWTDTRLYEITEDAGGLNGTIMSKELSSSNLALEAGTATELDMGDPNTLKNFLKFGRENYPAEKYALIIWGRGTGWRSVAIDEYSGSDMSLTQLQEAIASSSTPLDFIGFDTNFGGNIETAWELKDEASWFAGTAGLAPLSGWDYAEVLEDFSASGMDAGDFADAVVAQGGVSKVNLTTIAQVKTSLDELAQRTASAIKTENDRDVVKNLLLTEVTSYISNIFPSDKFLDLYDLATTIHQNASRISSNSSIQVQLRSSATKLQASLSTVVQSGGTAKLGVHVIPLTSASVHATRHATAYIQGSSASEQLSFVHDSAGWVPTSAGTTSLLDKLFYATSFELIVRPWTVMVYMAADNDLEGAAIYDINELEASKFANKGISVLALLDRSEGHDGTNGNWTDTRLYEVTEDAGGQNGIIKSKELSSSELALEVGTATELDMSDPNTLKSFLKFGRANYPAEQYALIIWGHGTGWHSVAIDDHSGSAMSLVDLQEAIASSGGQAKSLDFIGFDTCFGATLETAWELKDEATWFAGTPGLAPVEGWDYTEVFEAFVKTGMSAEDFANAVMGQAGVSKINLGNIAQVKTSLDELARLTANAITTKNTRDLVKNLLLTEVDAYTSNTFPSDKFLDLYDLATIISSKESRISTNSAIQTQLQNASDVLQNSLKAAVLSNGTPKLAIYLIPFTSTSVPAASHSAEYVKGSGVLGQISFVRESTSWVPTSGGNTSLLDKVFYKSF